LNSKLARLRIRIGRAGAARRAHGPVRQSVGDIGGAGAKARAVSRLPRKFEL